MSYLHVGDILVSPGLGGWISWYQTKQNFQSDPVLMTSMRVTIGDKLSPGIYFWEDLLFWPNMSISSLDMCTSYPLCDIKFSPGKWGGQCVFAVFHLFCPHFFFFFFFKVELEITILTGGIPKCSLLQVIVFKVQSCLPYPFPNIPLSLSSFH